MTAATPARALGFGSVSRLRAVLDANLVLLECDLQVTVFMAHGNWADSRPSTHLVSITVTVDRSLAG